MNYHDLEYSLVVHVISSDNDDLVNTLIEVLTDDEDQLVDELASLVYSNSKATFASNLFLEENNVMITPELIIILLDYRNYLLEHEEPFDRLAFRTMVAYEGFSLRYRFVNSDTLEELKTMFIEFKDRIALVSESEMDELSVNYVEEILHDMANYSVVSDDYYNNMLDYFDKAAFGEDMIYQGWLDNEVNWKIHNLFDELMRSPVSEYIEDLGIEQIDTYEELESFVDNFYDRVYSLEDSDNEEDSELFEILEPVYSELEGIFSELQVLYESPEDILDTMYDSEGNYFRVFSMVNVDFRDYFDIDEYIKYNIEDIISSAQYQVAEAVFNDNPSLKEPEFFSIVEYDDENYYLFIGWIEDDND